MRNTLQATGVDECKLATAFDRIKCRTFAVPSFLRGMILPLTIFAAVSCSPAPLPTDPLTEPLVEEEDGTPDDGSGDTSSDDQASAEPIPTTIDLTGVPSTVESGDSVQLLAAVHDQNSEPIPDIEIHWSSSDTMIAKVTVAGMLYALSTGAVTVGAEVILEDGETTSAQTSSATSSSSSLKATHDVSVVKSGSRTATSLDLSTVPTSLQASDSVELVAMVLDQNNEPMSDVEVGWSSSDSTIAGVTTSGMLRALRAGAITLLAEVAPDTTEASSDATSVSASQEFSVTEEDMPTPTSIDLSAISTSLQVGDTVELAATVYDQDGQQLSDVDVSWSSSDATVAKVTTAGMLYALSGGAVSVQAEVAQDTTTLSESQEVSISSSDTGSDTETEQTVASGPVPAFPGAEGYGAMALSTCDRSQVRVIRVTNLGDSGYGTLREAFSIAENVPNVLKVVVFDVAGYIDLQGRIDFSGNCLYLAGQTAPGGGITIRNGGGQSFFFRNDVHDVAMRHLRLRGGYSGGGSGNINLIVGSGHDIILDHLSFGWTSDKLLAVTKYDGSFSHTVHRISVQNSILSEVFADHPTGMQLTGEDNDGSTEWKNIYDISVHDNLFAHNSHRNPATNADGVRLINNVVYNWLQGATQTGGKLDVINNYYRTGPMTDSRFTYEVTWNCDAVESDDQSSWMSLYVNGNMGPHSTDPSSDPWSGENRQIACYYKTGGTGGEPIPDHENYRRTSPQAGAHVPVSISSATNAYSSVLEAAGASARLTCDGTWTSNRDEVDQRVVDEVKSRSGASTPISHEDDVGGFPIISAGSPCSDSDKDGMPDDFESRFGFDPDNSKDAYADANQNGYTNVEDYLNGSSPR